MKTKTVGLILAAAGLAATRALAESSAAPTPPAGETPRIAVVQQVTVDQIILSEYHFHDAYKAASSQAKSATHQTLLDDSSVVNPGARPEVVFSMPPSPAFHYDAHSPGYWFPSITFPFGAGGERHS